MLGIPSDAMWVWVGLLLGSALMFGVIADLGAAPPDATRVADSVEEVQAVEYSTKAVVPVEATSMKLSTSRLALRGPGGTSHATFAGGDVIPARPETKLSDVLHGTPASSAFRSPTALQDALWRSRFHESEWYHLGKTITIRRIRYGEVDSVLVGP
ncbi:MAG: hypothetical protein ABEJ58_08080 [Halodesulfurarchaeum sp.]